MAEIVNGVSANETHANVKRSRSKFNLKQRVMDTYRFGEYHPHFVFDGVTSDKLIMRSIHTARSYTLKAPLMQDIQMHKDYFYVPLRAILPLQAERIVTNPTLGSDVPSDAYTFVEGFIGKIQTIDNALVSVLAGIDLSASPTDQDYRAFLCFYFKRLILLESIFSNGSLLASLGCNIHENLRIDCSGSSIPAFTNLSNPVFIDVYLDAFISYLLSVESGNYYVTIDGVDYIVKQHNFRKNNVNDISWHEFLSRIRDTSDWSFKSSFSSSLKAALVKVYNDVADTHVVFNFVNTGLGIDLARVWAYHLCQAEFYTNDKVDYIYSADLFRQYISSLVQIVNSEVLGSVPLDFYFNWNGVSLPYDYLSSFFFNFIVSNGIGSGDTPQSRVACLQYLYTLFGYHRSLRFKDYFTGARTRPLAVGDVNAPVVSNQVSVIDVTRKIQLQRYLNAVNSTGRKFEEYLKGIFGDAPSPDHHNPLFLAHTTDGIFAAEVENTGDYQWTEANSVTAVFRGNSNKFAFQFDVKEPCIILGITSFDIERAYPTIIERSFFTKDRFDMFIPQLQYVGDQMVYRAELNGTHTNPMSAFGYQFRDMHRKQLINRAQGGFSANVLPGYAFMYRSAGDNSITISPNFIRSICSELDEFYLSLTGFSLGTYFHFIVSNDNIVDASRPMAVNPQILG